MEPISDFNKHYKTISNAELLGILDNSRDYQPSAVEAAQKEFLARQLSDAELQEAREIRTVNQTHEERNREQLQKIQNKVKANGRILIETLNPIQSGLPSTEKTIRLVVVVFGGLFLFGFFRDFSMHIGFVRDIPRFPFTSTLYLLPLIILPIALFTFWKRKSIGWTLFTICMTFSTTVILWTLIQSFLWEPSGIAAFDNVFAAPPILTLIIQFLFYIGTLYLVCKQDMRNVFFIGENKMISTIAITGVFSFFAVYVTT